MSAAHIVRDSDSQWDVPTSFSLSIFHKSHLFMKREETKKNIKHEIMVKTKRHKYLITMDE